MRATGPAPGSLSTVKIGAKKDGTIVAAQGTFYLQAGGLPGLAAARAGRAAPSRRMPSRTSCRSASTWCPTARRSRPIARPARRSAPSRPNACWTRSREALGLDPLEMRLKNSAKAGDKAIYGPTFGARDLQGDGGVDQAPPALHRAARQEPAPWREARPRRRLRLLVQCRRRELGAGQHHRGRQRAGHDGPPRCRRLARVDRQRGGRAARRRSCARQRHDRRHADHRLLEPDGRQPRDLRLRHGRDRRRPRR